MKKIILIALLFIGFNSYAQFDKGGVIALSNKAVFALDTSARNIIHIIEDERVAAGGAYFSDNEKKYVNYIVTNLKSIGVWYKCKAIYGFVGGTAASDKWNWKDMRNLPAAFALTYTGTITHSNNGFQGDGSTGYANTNLAPLGNLSATSNHLSVFSYTTYTGGSAAVDVSSTTNSGNGSNIIELISTSSINQFAVGTSAGTYDILQIPTTNMFLLGSIFNGNIKLVNDKNLKSKSNTTIFSPSSVNILIGARPDASTGVYYSNRVLGCVTIGSGLTDSEAIMTSAIITFSQRSRANF
jgi:hypothetical protein